MIRDGRLSRRVQSASGVTSLVLWNLPSSVQPVDLLVRETEHVFRSTEDERGDERDWSRRGGGFAGVQDEANHTRRDEEMRDRHRVQLDSVRVVYCRQCIGEPQQERNGTADYLYDNYTAVIRASFPLQRSKRHN